MNNKYILLIVNAITLISGVLMIFYLFSRINNLNKELEIISKRNNAVEIQNSNYLYALSQFFATNTIRGQSPKIGVKFNDYGCDYCNKKVLNRLKEKFNNKTLDIIINNDSCELYNILKHEQYQIKIDSLKHYNFKSIEPVVFLSLNNNEYLFPFSPDMVLAPELFEVYLETIDSLIANSISE